MKYTRDTKTGALLNSDNEAYQKAIQFKKQQKSNKYKETQLEILSFKIEELEERIKKMEILIYGTRTC